MILKEEYRKFVINYEQTLEEFKDDADEYGDKGAKALAKVFKEIAHKIYPLTYKEWLNRELEDALKTEDFNYAQELKREIINL